MSRYLHITNQSIVISICKLQFSLLKKGTIKSDPKKSSYITDSYGKKNFFLYFYLFIANNLQQTNIFKKNYLKIANIRTIPRISARKVDRQEDDTIFILSLHSTCTLKNRATASTTVKRLYVHICYTYITHFYSARYTLFSNMICKVNFRIDVPTCRI